MRSSNASRSAKTAFLIDLHRATLADVAVPALVPKVARVLRRRCEGPTTAYAQVRTGVTEARSCAEASATHASTGVANSYGGVRLNDVSVAAKGFMVDAEVVGAAFGPDPATARTVAEERNH